MPQCPEQLSAKLAGCDLALLPGGSKYILNDEPLGEGAFGVVFSALDKTTGEMVALKQMKSEVFFVDRKTRNLCARRALREICLMAHFRTHPNVVKLIDILPPLTENFETLYLVMDRMDSSLHDVLKNRDISEMHVKIIIAQLMRALEGLHSANVMHRDVSTKNVLINSDCSVKLCDLGLARDTEGCELDCLVRTQTRQCTTLWWRAPEVIMECSQYTPAVDIWAAGCILGQMFRPRISTLGRDSCRRGLFKGANEPWMIDLITSVLGYPEEKLLCRIADQNWQSYVNQSYVRQKALQNKCECVEFSTFFTGPEHNSPKLPDSAVQLLHQMLHFDPEIRIKAKDVLQHEYFSDCIKHSGDSEFEEIIIPPFVMCEEPTELLALKQKIYAEAHRIHSVVEQSEHEQNNNINDVVGCFVGATEQENECISRNQSRVMPQSWNVTVNTDGFAPTSAFIERNFQEDCFEKSPNEMN